MKTTGQHEATYKNISLWKSLSTVTSPSDAPRTFSSTFERTSAGRLVMSSLSTQGRSFRKSAKHCFIVSCNRPCVPTAAFLISLFCKIHLWVIHETLTCYRVLTILLTYFFDLSTHTFIPGFNNPLVNASCSCKHKNLITRYATKSLAL